MSSVEEEHPPRSIESTPSIFIGSRCIVCVLLVCILCLLTEGRCPKINEWSLFFSAVVHPEGRPGEEAVGLRLLKFACMGVSVGYSNHRVLSLVFCAILVVAWHVMLPGDGGVAAAVNDGDRSPSQLVAACGAVVIMSAASDLFIEYVDRKSNRKATGTGTFLEDFHLLLQFLRLQIGFWLLLLNLFKMEVRASVRLLNNVMGVSAVQMAFNFSHRLHSMKGVFF